MKKIVALLTVSIILLSCNNRDAPSPTNAIIDMNEFKVASDSLKSLLKRVNMDSVGIKSIDDLAKIGEKGLTKSEKKDMANAIIKKLESTGQSDVINKIKLRAFESTPEFIKLKDKAISIADAWGNGTLIDDEIELAKAEVRNLQRAKINLSKSGLNEDELKLMYTELDTAIAKIEKNITKSGGKLEKVGERATKQYEKSQNK